ncbi:4Fe-4S cluster-binding domain-containing protein [bacterium]|nr:4Fe-4S cluster-binding domain-containing protein [bacterium]
MKKLFTHYENCALCEHNCFVNRKTDEGFCKASEKMFVASEMVHVSEEVLINPTYAIFISGCNARCNFCYNSETAFNPQKGVEVSPKLLAKQIDFRLLQNPEVKTVSFLGGDPIPHLPKILETISFVKTKTSFVFNSNFFLTQKVLKKILPFFDIFLVDYKFGNDFCAEKIAQLPNYTQVLQQNLLVFQKQKLLEKLLVRHLLMPKHFDCCFVPIVDWFAKNLDKVNFSLLLQFAGSQKLSEKDKFLALTYAESKKLKLVF